MEDQQSAPKTLFSNWISDPSAISITDAEGIEKMVDEFPYCQILRSVSAKAAQKQSSRQFKSVLGIASLYAPDRKVLFNLINHPEKLRYSVATYSSDAGNVDDDSTDVEYKELIGNEKQNNPQEYAPAEIEEAEVVSNPLNHHEIKDREESLVDESVFAHTDISAFQPDRAYVNDVEGIEEDVDFEALEADGQPSATLQEPDQENDSEEGVEEEVEPLNLAENNDPEIELETDGSAEEILSYEEPESEEDGTEADSVRDEEEKMILENITFTDFFAFEEKMEPRASEPAQKIVEENETAPAENVADNQSVPEPGQVSRYNDDTMPYTFLWWLHKTRSEHAESYQPYVDFKLDTSREIKKKRGVELNQQIMENIFHLQSPLIELEKTGAPNTVPFQIRRKEEEIIEKFIREEPQIHAPSPDKLDLENKARKSSEDPSDLVSETLASIYTEQMLYHKAIDTYHKLSLKFPEKRPYFADQISELQKKIN